MTVAADAGVCVWLGYLRQAVMVMLMNVPTVSFGLTMGWVSLASGEGEAGGHSRGEGDPRGVAGGGGDADVSAVVWAAATTFAAALLAVPLAARALHAGRKLTVVMTSLVLAACWGLKLAGGWWVVLGRVLAGFGGTCAWAVSPLLAREMCAKRVRGAAVASLVLAHNLGFALMYGAADARLAHNTVLWLCLGLSLTHAVVYCFMPESPAYLAANGDLHGARKALAWLRGAHVDAPALKAELEALPSLDDPAESIFTVVRNLVSDVRRRRALVVSVIAVVGQEACGVLALLQFAERVFVMARGEAGGDTTMAVNATMLAGAINNVTTLPSTLATPMSTLASTLATPVTTALSSSQLATPARHAVVLGVVQLFASMLALYLVERIGRRPLIVSTAVATAACLATGAGALWLGVGWRADVATTVALAGAVFFDSAGLQPAPYALLADMFHYEFRGVALMVATAGACAGNALEVLVFPLVAKAGGVRAALAMSAALTFLYALFVMRWVPETRGREPDEIYDAMFPALPSTSDTRKIPASEQSMSESPSSEQSESEKSVSELPTSQQPASEQHVSQLSKMEPPVSKSPVSERRPSQQPLSQQIASEQHATVTHLSRLPTSEQSVSQSPVSEHPVSKQASVQPSNETKLTLNDTTHF